MKKFAIILSCCGLLLLIALAAPLMIGIWLPDAITGRHRILAAERLPSGDQFYVVQYWNKVDFYTTEFVHIDPSGVRNLTVIGGDDNKRWKTRLRIDPSIRIASVGVDSQHDREIPW